MHHPQRQNVITSMVGFKNSLIHKNLTQNLNGEPKRCSLGMKKKNDDDNDDTGHDGDDDIDDDDDIYSNVKRCNLRFVAISNIAHSCGQGAICVQSICNTGLISHATWCMPCSAKGQLAREQYVCKAYATHWAPITCNMVYAMQCKRDSWPRSNMCAKHIQHSGLLLCAACHVQCGA